LHLSLSIIETIALRIVSIKENKLTVFSRPPFVGIFAFIAVLFVQPLGHIIMILMEQAYLFLDLSGGWYALIHEKGPEIAEGAEDFAIIRPYVYWSAFTMGLAGVWIIYKGVKKGTELAGTWAGFIGGTLVWTGWVEFSLHFHARYFGVKALCAPGSLSYSCTENPATKPEYFLMQSSIGLMLAIGIYFLLNKETRCNAFRWVHRVFNMEVGKPTKGLKRNFANIVATETIAILWFFYIYLMFVYDETIFGEHHWFTFASFVGFLLWSLYLIQRLLRYSKKASAIRYAIPTVIIFWNSIEIMGRWDWFDEFWIHPLEYQVEAITLTISVVGFIYISIKSALDGSR